MRILIWHVHGSWMTSFVHGRHEYLVPVVAERSADGLGRARTFEWPASAVEITKDEARDAEVDLVILQRPHELDHLAEAWLGGRRPGRDLPAVYLEHNAPQGPVNAMRHPAADRDDLLVVHVTHFNALFWDTGSTPSTVIEHGIVDPGHRYTGELERASVVVNEPVRRGRVTGTDLLPGLAEVMPLDVFGMGAAALEGSARGTIAGHENPPQAQLHDMMARRRAYLHPVRWTSLGLSLLEAMHLGMPVVGLATTEASEAVPADAGILSNRVDVVAGALRRLRNDPEEAFVRGKNARVAALARYGLGRFLDEWDDTLRKAAP